MSQGLENHKKAILLLEDAFDKVVGILKNLQDDSLANQLTTVRDTVYEKVESLIQLPQPNIVIEVDQSGVVQQVYANSSVPIEYLVRYQGTYTDPYNIEVSKTFFDVELLLDELQLAESQELEEETEEETDEVEELEKMFRNGPADDPEEDEIDFREITPIKPLPNNDD
jgi:hypothetical protein